MKTNEHASARLTLSFLADRVNVELDVNIFKAPGPFEYGFFFPYDTLLLPSGKPYVRLRGNYFEIGDDEFQSQGGSPLSFDLPDAHYELVSHGDGDFALSDMRKTPQKALRYLSYRQIDAPSTLQFRHVLIANDGYEDEQIAKRMKALAKPPVFVRNLPLENGGFENGVRDWNLPANAMCDTVVSHFGRQSMALTVCDPQNDPVYITRNIPVVGGAIYRASCFVKTENVKSAQGRQPSVGAGLILEWLDKSGHWTAPGDYACGFYGTSDWRAAKTKAVKAPDGAGYAQVFLALRGTGRAWFDDVTLSAMERSVEMSEPEPDAELSCNTPSFSWIDLPIAKSYTVELSQDPTFPSGSTRSYSVAGRHELRLKEPLEPGVWHWRVCAPGATNAIPRSFRQTVSLDRDCLPPEILTVACRVKHPHEVVSVKVRECGPGVPKLTLGKAVGVCGSTDANGVRIVTFRPPENGWPLGFAELSLEAVDADGNKNVQPFWLLNAPKPDNAVTVDGDGRYSEKGEPIFPLGIYEVMPCDMNEVRAAGFDLVHTYRWEDCQDDSGCLKYLDACWSSGKLRAFIGFDRGLKSGNGIIQGNFASVARRVGALANHPALFCWYLYDEPEVQNQYVSAARLTLFADIVRALDPYHPVVMTTWTKSMIDYRRTWDTHWTQAYGNPASIVSQIDEHRAFLHHDSPITLVVYSNDNIQGKARRAGQKTDPEKYSLDYDYLKACAFLGVVKSCNGVMWWWFARDCRDYYTVAHSPMAWANLGAVVRELVALRSSITASGAVTTGHVADGESTVEWWRKTMPDGTQLLIAVNTGTKSACVTINGQKLAFRRYEVKVLR